MKIQQAYSSTAFSLLAVLILATAVHGQTVVGTVPLPHGGVAVQVHQELGRVFHAGLFGVASHDTTTNQTTPIPDLAAGLIALDAVRNRLYGNALDGGGLIAINAVTLQRDPAFVQAPLPPGPLYGLAVDSASGDVYSHVFLGDRGFGHYDNELIIHDEHGALAAVVDPDSADFPFNTASRVLTNPRSGKAYIMFEAGGFKGQLVVLDMLTRRITARLNVVGNPDGTCTMSDMVSGAVDEIRNKIYVAGRYTACEDQEWKAVLVVDGNTDTIENAWILSERLWVALHGTTINPITQHLFVTQPEPPGVEVLDANNGASLKFLQVTAPFALATDLATGVVYAASANEVALIQDVPPIVVLTETLEEIINADALDQGVRTRLLALLHQIPTSLEGLNAGQINAGIASVNAFLATVQRLAEQSRLTQIEAAELTSIGRQLLGILTG